MARLQDRERALTLRLQGWSYSQIKAELVVSKGTLSGWLQNYPLSRERINELRARSEKRIELFRVAMRRKREIRFATVYESEKRILAPLSERELYIAGLLLYVGEGAKSKPGTVMVANSDPAVMRFFTLWLLRICKVPKEKVRVRLQIYKDMNADAEVDFWSRELDLPRRQFTRPQIKQGYSSRINFKGGFNHGTCDVLFHSVPLHEKIMAGIKVILGTAGA